MDKTDLLAEFQAQLALFDKYQTFIDKARSYSERFNPAVVEKVIADNTEKIGQVAAVLNPRLRELRAEISKLEAEIGAIDEDSGGAQLALEELGLRLAIGEIDEAGYQDASEELRGQLDGVSGRREELAAEAEALSGVLNAWLAVRPDEVAATPEEPTADDVLGEPEEDEGVALESDEEDDLLGMADDRAPGLGVHSEQPGIADDVSDVFGGDDSPMEAEDGGIDFSANEIGDLGDDLLGGGASTTGASSGGEGRAVLILAEGTSEEQVFHFVGDGISIGRARDNTIQVRNDSKVSRNHCRIFKRNGAFYIEDNKSANGTQVDGELVTEKRLLGGEEVVVGETEFRFRLQG